MINGHGVANVVKQNLVYHNMWSDVDVVGLKHFFFVKGKRPDCDKPIQYILPVERSTKLTMENLDSVFDGISALEGKEISELVVGISDVDGSVVYYNAFKGISKTN